MKRISINSYGKINLSLDVLGVNSDGYHRVSMVMQQIALHDDVLVRFVPYEERPAAELKSNKDIHEITVEVSTNRPYIPRDERNIAYKAAALMAERYGRTDCLAGGKVRIDIKKRIPVSAGLAGGSGNAAAVLHGLNKLWELKLSLNELCALGSQLGADVPFCVMGQARANSSLDKYIRKDPMAAHAALAEGIGADLTPIKGIKRSIILCRPPISVSTREVYSRIDEEIALIEKHQELTRPDNKRLIKAMAAGDDEVIKKNMINMLELYTLKAYPAVEKIKETIEEETRPLSVMMSGSGPTVFAMYKGSGEAKMAYMKVAHLAKETYLTETTY